MWTSAGLISRGQTNPDSSCCPAGLYRSWRPGKPWQSRPGGARAWYARPVLIGREAALARIAWVVSGARAGRGGALLLRGEPGCGKTALLGAAAEDSDGMTVLPVSYTHLTLPTNREV